jgi:MFS transporter, DHA1 family, tetracycline resistance protein
MKHPPFSLKETAPLFFAILIDIFGFGLVYPVFTALFTSAHASILPADVSAEMRFFYLGVGFLLYPLFMFFGSSFMGDLSDIWGRKKVLLLCMGGLFFGFLLMGLGVSSSSLTLLFVGRGLSGLMGASMPLALAAIADLSTPENKAVHMSIVALVQSIGFVLGPLLGGVLSDKNLVSFFSFSLPFFVSSILAIFAFFWIWKFFKESFVKKEEKRIDFKRIFQVFVEASKNPPIRLLCLVFLLMQMAIALYLQLILIYYKQVFSYSSVEMGFFNGYLGVWFAVGIIFVVPYAAKRYRIEKTALFFLLITGVSELLIAFIPYEYLLWLFAIPLAIAVNVAYAAMYTSFSNAADANSQGWVMGIGGSVVAISFVITGLSPTLVPVLGVKLLIFIGALLMLLGTLLMGIYCKRFLPHLSHGKK